MNAIPAWLQRGLVVMMPPMALLVCCAVMVPRHNKLQQVNNDIRTARTEVATYVQQLDEISKLPPDPTVATLPMSKEEQSDFLRGLSILCNRTGNKIVSVASLAAPPAPAAPPPGSSAPTKSATTDGIPPDVLPITSQITFSGTFDSLRAFMKGLEGSRRLISMSELRIGASTLKYPDLQTMLEVTRYVDAPPEYAAAVKPAARTH